MATDDHHSLADLSILATVSAIIVSSNFSLKNRQISNKSNFQYCGFDISNLKNLSAWFKRCESIPGFAEQDAGARTLANAVLSKDDKPF